MYLRRYYFLKIIFPPYHPGSTILPASGGIRRIRRHKKDSALTPPPRMAASNSEGRRPTTAPAISIPRLQGSAHPVSCQHQQARASISQGQRNSFLSEKQSLFRQLKARATAKRARSPAVPQVPVTAVVSQETAAEPHPSSRAATPPGTQPAMDLKSPQPPSNSILKIPSFLEVSAEGKLLTGVRAQRLPPHYRREHN